MDITLPKIRGSYKFNYNIAPLTWMKVGGTVDVLFKPKDLDDLIYFLQKKPLNIKITLIGAGSNLIIRDGGVEGVAIKLTRDFSGIKILPDGSLLVGAGCLNYNLAKFAAIKSLQGFEFLIGIPGTIGGGIAMNAGAYGYEFKDLVISVEALDYKGNIKTFLNNELGFSYRKNSLPKNLIFTKVIFKCKTGQPKEIQSKMNAIIKQRKMTQPITEKTSGSTFANPEGNKAWELVDQAGLRGYSIGGAVMSKKHCNFMINNGTATALDLENLGEFVRKKIKDNSGIDLEWEIKIIGKKVQEFNTIYKETSLILNCNNKKKQNLANLLKTSAYSLANIEPIYPKGLKPIAVVGCGMSAEREISLMSSNGIVDSLLELGYYVIFIDMGADIASVLNKIRPDIVFNALHGTYGEDGCLPGLLNILKIPYTGPGVLSSSLAMNKYKSHEILKVNNIKVADMVIVKKSDQLASDPMPRPYVIKPLSQGSSVGVKIIFSEDQFSFADYKFKYGDEVIIEKYIEGREIQVALLNGKSMGALEIKILNGKRFYDYEVKYTKGLSNHLLPAPLSKENTKRVEEISEKSCEIFNCKSGIARTEFIYNEKKDDFYMLEINTHPGMTTQSIVPEIIAMKGINYTNLVYRILQNAKFE